MKNTSFGKAKHLIINFLCFLQFAFLNAQNVNLVVNPSFEQRAISTNKYRMADGIDTISEFDAWTSPTAYQAEIYGSDKQGIVYENADVAKGQRDFKARTGVNVASVLPYGMTFSTIEKPHLKRTYLQGELTTPLTVGDKYYVGFWLHYHCISTTSVGMAFALKETVKDTSIRLFLTPVVYQKQLWDYDAKRTWLLIRDSFVADKPYQNLYIGNFFSNDSTGTSGSKTFSHYVAYVDDVFVISANDKAMPPRKIVVKPPPPMPKILNRVQFRYNSTEFESFSYFQLDSAVLTLKGLPNLKILIVGHTSTEGAADKNQQLSERRAEAVKQYLVGKGIAAERLKTQGFGARQPLTSENSEEDRKRNRRIEFVEGF